MRSIFQPFFLCILLMTSFEIFYYSFHYLDGGKMTFWFVVHDLLAYSQHPDMIACTVRNPSMRAPKFARFADIEKGDNEN